MSKKSNGFVNDALRYPLITRELVTRTLKTDQGEGAVLKNWRTKDFTQKGDNFVSDVTSVLVDFEQKGESRQTSYVAKARGCRSMESFNQMSGELFNKEGQFYTVLLPELNDCLVSNGCPPLRLPVCYAVNLELDKEVILMEDLRNRGFKMFDRKKGMDMSHSILVLEELARLHGASALLQKKYKDENLVEKFPCLFDVWFGKKGKFTAQIDFLIKQNMQAAARIVDTAKGYEAVSKWIRDLQPKSMEVLLDQLVPTPDLAVINHGDCWNNNILFRYDEDGEPVEVMLLDLQIVRVANPGCDLNYFLYTSLNGSLRHNHLDDLLYRYYLSFTNTMEASGHCDPPFSLEDLRSDFNDHSRFGVMFAMLIVPVLLAESEDTPSFDDMTDDTMAEFLEKRENQIVSLAEANPLLRPRFLSMFDELLVKGIIC